MTMLRNRPLFRLLSLALIPGLLSACASFQQQGPPFAPHVERGPDRVRLALADGRVLELRHPNVSGDSIVGEVFPELRVSVAGAEGATVAARTGASIEDVALMEVRKTDVGRSILAGIGVVLGVFVAALGLSGGVGP